MSIAHPFVYEKPATVGQAVKLLSRYGKRARVLAGGTDLIGLMVDSVERPERVVDLKGIRGLKDIKREKSAIVIGPLTTFTDVLDSSLIRRKLPVMAEMAGWVASRGVRNRGTIAGNICSAVPCCDSGPILLVYRAEILVKGPRGARRVPIDKWFTGPRTTVLKPKELVTGIRIPDAGRHAGCFVKMRRYRGEDLAQASVTALLLPGKEWRIAFGSVAPTPIQGKRIERLLKGKALSAERIEEAVNLTAKEISPITDIRSTREYRAHMIRIMTRRALEGAVSRMAGKGPEYGTELI